MTDNTVPIEVQLLKDIRAELEDTSNMNGYRLETELDHILENYNHFDEQAEHYYEEFQVLDDHVTDNIESLTSQRATIQAISDAVAEIDCDWGGASVETTTLPGSTKKTVSIKAHTERRCEPIDRLYDLEDDVDEFESNLEYINVDHDDGTASRYLEWTFELTLE